MDLFWLAPVLVSGGGRSGTTVLMRLLGSSPVVAFDRIHPYEHRYLTFLYRMAALARPVDPRPDGWSQQVMATRQEPMMGPIPWRHPGLIDRPEGDPEFWRELFEASWTVFSDRARRAAEADDPSAPAPTHYAEKCPPWLPAELRGWLPEVAELVPIRDPRDVFVSAAAFVEQRGSSGFGIRHGESLEEGAARFVGNARSRLETAIAAESLPDVTVIRYEDLMVDTAAEVARISTAVGLELDPAVVHERTERVERHRTSASAEASVGRWRHELEPEIAAMFAPLGELLETVGYEV